LAFFFSLFLECNGIEFVLDIQQGDIIIALFTRWCWNWQTGMVEGHVPQGMGVQVPPSALEEPYKSGFLF
jgi:hypothetical protein